MSALEDTRCDVCLYFVAPHSLRPLDITMMARIGCLVPVVPIIAKVGLSLSHAYTQCRQGGRVTHCREWQPALQELCSSLLARQTTM